MVAETITPPTLSGSNIGGSQPAGLGFDITDRDVMLPSNNEIIIFAGGRAIIPNSQPDDPTTLHGERFASNYGHTVAPENQAALQLSITRNVDNMLKGRKSNMDVNKQKDFLLSQGFDTNNLYTMPSGKNSFILVIYDNSGRNITDEVNQKYFS